LGGLVAVIFPLMEMKMEIHVIFFQKWKVRMEFNLKWKLPDKNGIRMRSRNYL